MYNNRDIMDTLSDNLKSVVITGGIVAACTFASLRFRVAGANQTLIRYGFGYGRKIKPSQSGFVWPGQGYDFIDMYPTQTRIEVSCNSSGLIPFKLPIVLSTQPVDWRTDPEGFDKYCRTYAGKQPEEMCSYIEDLLSGVIRTSASALSVMDMIAKKKEIYNELEAPVYDILKNEGIHTQKCNIEEVLDILPNGGYIDELRRKSVASAQNTAETDVKKSETERRIAVAELQQQAIVAENINKQLEAMSRAELAEIQATETRRRETAVIEARVATKLRETELERKMFEERQKTETERLRSDLLVKTNIDAEARVREALGWGDSERSKSQGNADAVRIKADAERYNQEQQALANRFIQEQTAEGKLVADIKEAQGTLAKYEAKADGIRKVNAAASENPELAQFQMALEAGLPQSLAQSSADALQNLKPTIWYTGSANGKDPMEQLMTGVQKAVPFLTTMSEQSGLDITRIFPHANSKK